MTRRIWVIGGNLTGLIVAYRLLHYGFRIDILEQKRSEDPPDQTETFPPVWPGFFKATWSLLQELAFSRSDQIFEPAPLQMIGRDSKRIPLPRLPFFSRHHLVPELLFFRGISLADRVRLLNFLEKRWEALPADEATPDTRTVEPWVISARQSADARHQFWNPLCRWLMGCDMSQASLRIFLDLLFRYAKGLREDTRTFLGSSRFPDILKRELRKLLIRHDVHFQNLDEYPPFGFDPNGSESLLMEGNFTRQPAAMVLTLPPQKILSLMPERALTRFSQLNLMSKIPRHTGSLLHITIPNHRIPPGLILSHHEMVLMVVEPSDSSQPASTRLTCLFHDTPGTTCPSSEDIARKTWDHIRTVFDLSPHLTLQNCPISFLPSAITMYPAQAGTRTFRPQSTSPIPNLFFAGPWTATPLPHSMENLVASANACAEALAHKLFSRSH